MDDQLRQLEEKNIPVVCLNSNNSNKSECLEEIYAGKAKIIYTSPEYIAKNNSFISKLYKLELLCLIAIDESHCVSNWGNGFRPDYKKLSILKKLAPTIPLLALTATATEKIKLDICNILSLQDPVIITSSFNRPNLSISVEPRENTKSKNFILDKKIANLIMNNNHKKILIYCKTKAETNLLAEYIENMGVPAEASYNKSLLSKTKYSN